MSLESLCVRRSHWRRGLIGSLSALCLLGVLGTVSIAGRPEPPGAARLARTAERDRTLRIARPVRERAIRAFTQARDAEQAAQNKERAKAIAAGKEPDKHPIYQEWQDKAESFALTMVFAGDDAGAASILPLFPTDQRKSFQHKLIRWRIARLTSEGNIPEAQVAVVGLTGEAKDDALLEIVEGQTNSGEFDAAEDTAAQIVDMNKRQRAIKDVGEQLAVAKIREQLAAGDYQGAITASDNLENVDIQANVRSDIATVLWKAGDKAQASAQWDRASAETNSYDRSVILTERASAGDHDGAIRAAISVKEVGEQISLLAAIGEAVMKAGHQESAREAFARASALVIQLKAEIHVNAWAVIANAQVKAGDFAAARATADRITGEGREGPLIFGACSQVPLNRANVLFNIAQAQAKAGDYRSAQKTLEPLDANSRSLARDLLADYEALARAKAGDFAGATAVADRVTRYYRRTSVLLVVAQEQVKRGKISDARALVTQAREIGRIALRDPEGRDPYPLEAVLKTYWLPTTQGGLGDPSNADSTAAQLEPLERADAWVELYNTLAKEL